ncbi:MAG: PstS family phosphate ABC transporter substrate-binding protein [Candidatus Firestonebacteria bacterium]|jgi:phosphate transport system substrate-binding protein|nr:PstS family phosphate ABC transporter substrate-binding protein [Candidatus Firestonebacteria bacterium]
MKNRVIRISVVALCFLTFGCSKESRDNAALAKSKSIQIKGSDTIVNLVQKWAEDYSSTDASLNIGITGGGSGTGFAAIINGTCDIAMSSRSIEEAEIKQAEGNKIHPFEYKVGLDGLMVIVNPKNPVVQLTLDQVRNIFMGNIKNWKELGGPDKKIVILSRESNSGTHMFFKEHVIRKGNKKSKDEFSPKALLMSSSQAIVNEISQNPNALGYVGIGYMSAELKAIAIAKKKGDKFVSPDIDSVLSDKYPISRPLFLYASSKDNKLVNALIAYALSDQGQKTVRKLDFVPLRKL